MIPAGLNSVLLPLILSVATGVGIAASNIRRPINQAFVGASLLTAIWLVSFGMVVAPRTDADSAAAVFWFRMTSAAGALFPAQLWWIYLTAVWGQHYARDGRWRSLLLWTAGGLALALLCFTPWFIPPESTKTNRMFGPLYSVYSWGLIAGYLAIMGTTLTKLRTLKGNPRLELSLVATGIVCCLLGLVLTSISSAFGLVGVVRTVPLLVVVFYTVTAWGIANYRVFEARDVFLSASRWLIVVLLITVWVTLCQAVTGRLLPAPLNLAIDVASSLLLYLWIEQPLRRRFAFSLTRRRESPDSVRSAFMVAARESSDLGELRAKIETRLAEWAGGTSVALLLQNPGESSFANTAMALTDSSSIEHLQTRLWVTPESLQRRPETSTTHDLNRFMESNRIGLIVASPARPKESHPVIIAMGPKADHSPWTWPETAELIDLAEAAEAAMERLFWSIQSKQGEQLYAVGILGVTMAHEIRNPLTALSAMAELLEVRHHEPEFRNTFSALLHREVERIQSIADGLRHLAASPDPRLSSINPTAIAREAATLFRSRAEQDGITLVVESSAPGTIALGNETVLRQVLMNLLANARDAIKSGGVPNGEIKIVIRNHRAACIVLEVSDNGPGIDPAQRAKLFTPFSSTKVHGFGLGLAYSARLMRSLRGGLALVESSAGATFRLTLQCSSPATS